MLVLPGDSCPCDEQPILRTLPSKAPFSKSLILGIALASNIGGMASPISSPQNLSKLVASLTSPFY